MAAQGVVVVGSGMAGAVAALTAARALPQVQVLVLEKESDVGGNSAWANSGINTLALDRGDSADTFKQDILKSGGGSASAELVDALVSRSQEAMQFLEAQGVPSLGSVARLGGQSVARTCSPPPGTMVGQAIMAALQQGCAGQPNLEVRTGIRAAPGLRRDSSRGVWHVVTSSPAAPGSDQGQQQQQQQQGVEAHAVVLATGGYAASNALLQQYAPYAAGLGTTNRPCATGDGLALGQSAGAKAVDLEYVQLNPTGIIDARDPGSPTKTVAPEKLRGLGAVLVNLEGRRFVNELATRDVVSQAILQQPQRQAILLLGRQTADSFGSALDEYLSRGLINRADSMAELAEATALPEQQLAAELEAYNAAAASGGPDSFAKAAFPAHLDLGGPFFWARVTPVAHYCMGGLAIDSSARVLDAEGEPIPGLFAVGEVAGGVHGKNLLVGNSLLECVVFGRIAGEAAAAYAAQMTAAPT